jgi:hypothetical protein
MNADRKLSPLSKMDALVPTVFDFVVDLRSRVLSRQIVHSRSTESWSWAEELLI